MQEKINLSKISKERIKQFQNCLLSNSLFVDKKKLKAIFYLLVQQYQTQINKEKQKVVEQTNKLKLEIQTYQKQIKDLQNYNEVIQKQLNKQIKSIQQQKKREIFALTHTKRIQKQKQLADLRSSFQKKVRQLNDRYSDLQTKCVELNLLGIGQKMILQQKINTVKEYYQKKLKMQTQQFQLKDRLLVQKQQEQQKIILKLKQQKRNQEEQLDKQIVNIKNSFDRDLNKIKKQYQTKLLEKSKHQAQLNDFNESKHREIKIKSISSARSKKQPIQMIQSKNQQSFVKMQQSHSKLQQKIKSTDRQLVKLQLSNQKLKNQLKSLQSQLMDQFKLHAQQLNFLKNQKQNLQISHIFNIGKLFCLFFNINFTGKQLSITQTKENQESNKLLKTHEENFKQLLSTLNNNQDVQNQNNIKSSRLQCKQSLMKIFESIQTYIREKTKQNQHSIFKLNAYLLHSSFSSYFKICLQKFYEQNNKNSNISQKSPVESTIMNISSLKQTYSKYNKIQFLSLFNCNLSDENSKLLKNQFTTSLKKLDLSGNHISDKFILNIQFLLLQLINLDLCFTNISNLSLKSIGHFMTKCRVLDVSYTNIDEQGLKYLTPLKNLQQLMIWSGQQYYPDCYKKYLSIQTLSRFKTNLIKINDLSILTKFRLKKLYINLFGENLEFSHLKQIRVLYINGSVTISQIKKIITINQIKDIQVEYIIFQKTNIICNLLEVCRKKVYNYKQLYDKLTQNPINILRLDLEPQTILKLKEHNYRYFKQLHLPFSNLGDAGTIEIAQNFKNLKVLNLSNNKIKNQGVISITNNLLNLAVLDLSTNMIENQGIFHIAQKLQELLQLFLNENLFDQNGIIQIVKCLKKLTKLSIQDNHFNISSQMNIRNNIFNSLLHIIF